MNDKSVFKKLTCPECRKWEADHTGKDSRLCAKCGVKMVHSDKWNVRMTRQGKTILKAVSSRRSEAVDYLHAAKDAVRRGQLLPGEEKSITWDDAVKEFTKWVEGGNVSEKTALWYKGHLKHLSAYFDCDLSDITVKMVETYLADRLEDAAPKTAAEEVKTLKRIFALHCRWHSARNAPMLHAVASDLTKVGMPKFNNKRTRFLTEAEVTLLMEQSRKWPHLHLAIQIALSTGLRLANICGLEWKQIDFVNRTITFSPDEMKSRRLHVSPLMEHLSAQLVEWRKQQGMKRISPYVFPSPTVLNEPMTNMRTSWEHVLEACNAILKKQKKSVLHDVVFHTLRHTFASHFLMNGGDLATLSELLDHASIQITKDRYGHLSSEHKLRAIDQFSGVFFKTHANR